MYFCLTIGTTVGYGDTAPSTFNGRLLFIFYVIPGICVCGAMIGEIGMLIYEQLQRGKVSLTRYLWTESVRDFVFVSVASFKIPVRFQQRVGPEPTVGGPSIPARLNLFQRMYQLKFKHVWIYWTLNSIFGFAFFLFVPAAIIDGFTDWNYFEAVYFSMVTFTTVGFGDLTITDHNAKFLILVFSYFG